MTDKIFEDNDLLDEKSYDTRIAEAANVQPDATYLQEDGYKKRLTEAIESGGGSGGVEYTLRKITFVNNRGAGSLKNAVKINKNVLTVAAAVISGGGRTVECEILASNYSTSSGKYAKQHLVFNGADADLTFTGDYVRDAGHDDKNYIIAIETCPVKDITITIS